MTESNVFTSRGRGRYRVGVASQREEIVKGRKARLHEAWYTVLPSFIRRAPPPLTSLYIFTAREIVVKGLHRPRRTRVRFYVPPGPQDRPSSVTRCSPPLPPPALYFFQRTRAAPRARFYRPAYDGLVSRRYIVILFSRVSTDVLSPLIEIVILARGSRGPRQGGGRPPPRCMNAPLSRRS